MVDNRYAPFRRPREKGLFLERGVHVQDLPVLDVEALPALSLLFTASLIYHPLTALDRGMTYFTIAFYRKL